MYANQVNPEYKFSLQILTPYNVDEWFTWLPRYVIIFSSHDDSKSEWGILYGPLLFSAILSNMKCEWKNVIIEKKDQI